MVNQLYVAPLVFLASGLSYFSSSKISIQTNYFNAITGGSLVGLSLLGLNPSINYDSFYVSLCTICSIFFLFVLNILSLDHNSKHTSLITNLTHNSIYGLSYGFILSYTSGLEFIQYIISFLLCNLTTSYSLGIKYIEYSKYLPLVYSSSLPIGLVIGHFSNVNNLNLLHAIYFGVTLMSGIKHIVNSLKQTKNELYREESNTNYLNLGCILGGIVLSCILYSPLLTTNSENVITELVSNSTNITELVSNSTNITELVSNSTNITELVSNSTNITGL